MVMLKLCLLNIRCEKTIFLKHLSKRKKYDILKMRPILIFFKFFYKNITHGYTFQVKCTSFALIKIL